jgi:hypothetical protein
MVSETASETFTKFFADDHIHLCLFEHFTEKELCILSMVCKKWHGNQIFENYWKALCCKRWGLTDSSRKSLGGANLPSMRDVYKLLHLRMQIPNGKFTTKQNKVFGKVYENGIGIWLLVGHGKTAMLKESKFQGHNCNRIELRLCIQNLSSDVISLPLTATAVEVRCNESEEVALGELAHSDLRVIAKNGQVVPSSPDHVIPQILQNSLDQMDFVVVSFYVYCPESIESEPDFLTMISKLALKINRTMGSHSSANRTDVLHFVSSKSVVPSIQQELIVKRNRDEEIWSSYQTLPNGLVMMQDQQNNW